MAEEIKSYSQLRREFYERYISNIVPAVQKFENARKIKLAFAIILVLVIIALGVWILRITYIIGDFSDLRCREAFYKGVAFFLASAYISWWLIKKSFENSVKTQIMPIVCSCFGNMKWYHGKYNGGKFFSLSGVIPKFTLEAYDDIFFGSFEDVNFEIVESRYTDNSRKHSVFNGIIVKLTMNKNFTSHTVIKPNSLIHISPLKDLRYTELEDVEFNKKYDVYTNDEVDARYLITPAFMERLKNMRTAFKASSVSCAFYGDLLIIALTTNKDIFSICSLIKKVDDSKQYFQMYEEILSIAKLIDHFKLNQKIGI